MALIDLSAYKSLMGVQAGDTRDDAQVTALLEPASKAVQTFTGRDFTIASTSSSRSFIYDGSGFLDIDDCTNITSVQVNIPNANPYVLSSDEYTAMPDGGPVVYYLILHGGVTPYAISPEMGFERNLDQYPASHYKSPTIQVTATWGWSAVPDDVKLATALTIKGFLGSQGGGAAESGLSAEAIEGWSRSWGGRGGNPLITSLAIPNRARDLLANYQRLYV